MNDPVRNYTLAILIGRGLSEERANALIDRIGAEQVLALARAEELDEFLEAQEKP